MKNVLALLLVFGLAAGSIFATGQSDSGSDVIKLKAACTGNVTEANTKVFYYFLDLVEKKSNGQVKFSRFPGGTLASPPEELDLVKSGSVDIVPLAHMPHADFLPLLNFPSWISGDQQKAVDYFNSLVFENPVTAPLIKAEADKNNIVYLAFVAGGANAFASKKPFTTLKDLQGLKFGAGGNIDAFESIGLSIVHMFPPDGYDFLSRGLVDATQMAFNPMIQLKWYEQAPYFMFDGTYAAGNPFTVNIDTWNKLPDDIKKIFQEAAKEASVYSVKVFNDEMKQNIDFLKSKGVSVGTLSQSDRDTWFNALFDSCVKVSDERARRLGIVDDNAKVIEAAKAFVGR